MAGYARGYESNDVVFQLLSPVEKERYEQMAKDFKAQNRGKSDDMQRRDNIGNVIAVSSLSIFLLNIERLKLEGTMSSRQAPGWNHAPLEYSPRTVTAMLAQLSLVNLSSRSN